jgi:hypothetical protein
VSCVPALDLSGPAAVYRVYAARDLLYIGLTRNVEKRLAWHAQFSPWWPSPLEVRHTAEWFACRSDAALAEAIAIVRENPRHNARRDRCRCVGGRWVDLATFPTPVPMVSAAP